MLVQQYPVTTPYGYVPGYPLHNGFHQGIDYGCPVGTPVIVNGVTIGISGNTGYTFGPHCHVGKWLGGVVQNPLNGGFSFTSAVVTEINEDADDGKYVRVQGDGYSWVYLHLSDNSLVKVGQVLVGGDDDMTMTVDEMSELRYAALRERQITQPEFDKYSKDVAGWAKYLEALQEQYGIVPANGTDVMNAAANLGLRRAATPDEISKYMTTVVDGVKYFRVVQDEHGITPQPSTPTPLNVTVLASGNYRVN